MNGRSVGCRFRTFVLVTFGATLFLSHTIPGAASESPQNASISRRAETMLPLTFSKLLFRQIGEIEVWRLTEVISPWTGSCLTFEKKQWCTK